MQFLYETKKNGIISVEADIVNGELKIELQTTIEGKQENKDIVSIARTVLAMEGKVEDIRNYK